MKSAARSQARKYQQLLIVLIVTFFISPFLKAGIGSVFSALLLLYTIIVLIRGLALPRLLFSVYSAIALIAFGLELAASLDWVPFFNQTFAVLAQAIFALYLGGAAYWIGRDIFTAPEVTADTVRGGISVYLLLGFVWALFYGMVATLDAGAFSEPLLLQESYLKAFHFSFTTLTTLGYGDIVPMSDIALVLTNLEAIIGQMYSTVFIAILVGGYLSRQSEG
ncbi:MAG: ion channel [Cyanobacteria bacterium P01_G01_bin.38]